jgi:hypothetical protein
VIAAIAGTAAPEPEAGLWKATLATLGQMVESRHPEAVDRLKLEVAKLDAEISALVNRRELVAQTEEAEQQARERKVEEALQKVLAEHQAATLALVARREALPRIAERRERALGGEIKRLHARMKQVAKLLRQAERPKGAPRREAPEPEAALKPASRDIIGLLEGAAGDKGISHQQAAAARELADIHEAISRAGQVKAANLTGAGVAGGATFRDITISPRLDRLRSRKFLPWCDSLAEVKPVTLDIVIKVACYNIGLRALARHHRLRDDTVIVRLREGLDAYINQPKIPPRRNSRGQRALSEAEVDRLPT